MQSSQAEVVSQSPLSGFASHIIQKTSACCSQTFAVTPDSLLSRLTLLSNEANKLLKVPILASLFESCHGISSKGTVVFIERTLLCYGFRHTLLSPSVNVSH